MHVSEESDSGIVPMNHSNNEETLSAEKGEGRPLIKENTPPSHTHPTQSGELHLLVFLCGFPFRMHHKARTSKAEVR